MKRWAFWALSHRGWCLLKLPSHMVCSGPVECVWHSQSHMHVDR